MIVEPLFILEEKAYVGLMVSALAFITRKYFIAYNFVVERRYQALASRAECLL
jgi:hypothetical protein